MTNSDNPIITEDTPWREVKWREDIGDGYTELLEYSVLFIPSGKVLNRRKFLKSRNDIPFLMMHWNNKGGVLWKYWIERM